MQQSKNMKMFRGFLIAFVFAFALLIPSSVSAATSSSTDSSVTTSSPKINISLVLKPRKSFVVTAKGVKKVQYTIEYLRTAGKNKTQLEGLMGSGTTKNGSLSKTHFAGTQSSKYFIAHDVKSGSLKMTGTDSNGKKFSYSTSFVVKNNKLTLSK
jgi:photosystem II stability/assembly factor-like uncharacterized protein